MTGCGVEGVTSFGVDPQIGGGYELATQVCRQNVPQMAKKLRRISSMCGNRLYRHLNHGSNQGSGYAMTGDVCDKKSDAVFIYRQKLIEISRHCGHRLPRGRKCPPAQPPD